MYEYNIVIKLFVLFIIIIKINDNSMLKISEF